MYIARCSIHNTLYIILFYDLTRLLTTYTQKEKKKKKRKKKKREGHVHS